MKSAVVCKMPLRGFRKTMLSSRRKWEREACGRDNKDPYSQRVGLGNQQWLS